MKRIKTNDKIIKDNGWKLWAYTDKRKYEYRKVCPFDKEILYIIVVNRKNMVSNWEFKCRGANTKPLNRILANNDLVYEIKKLDVGGKK